MNEDKTFHKPCLAGKKKKKSRVTAVDKPVTGLTRVPKAESTAEELSVLFISLNLRALSLGLADPSPILPEEEGRMPQIGVKHTEEKSFPNPDL